MDEVGPSGGAKVRRRDAFAATALSAALWASATENIGVRPALAPLTLACSSALGAGCRGNQAEGRWSRCGDEMRCLGDGLLHCQQASREAHGLRGAAKDGPLRVRRGTPSIDGLGRMHASSRAQNAGECDSEETSDEGRVRAALARARGKAAEAWRR